MNQWNLDNRIEHFGKDSWYNMKYYTSSLKIKVFHEMLDIYFKLAQIRKEFVDIQTTVKPQKPEEFHVWEAWHFHFSQS